jgi:hypothetical protein
MNCCICKKSFSLEDGVVIHIKPINEKIAIKAYSQYCMRPYLNIPWPMLVGHTVGFCSEECYSKCSCEKFSGFPVFYEGEIFHQDDCKFYDIAFQECLHKARLKNGHYEIKRLKEKYEPNKN